jgi:hypothetical protein
MKKRFLALGLMLAVTIAGAAWAHQSTNKIAARVEIVDAGTGGATSSANERQLPKTGSPRRLLGLCLLAMTGTTVVLRARRPRTI